MQNYDGRKALADELTLRAAELTGIGSSSQSARCLFEAALLRSKPGEINPELQNLREPAEVACWRAHARYAPRTSSIDTLKNLAAYAGKNGAISPSDTRLALYSASYTWRNAVAGENQYALHVNVELGTILGTLDRKSSEGVIAFLGDAILKDDAPVPDESPGLYMMTALSLMPGLAYGSDLKGQATAWLADHGTNAVVVRKEMETREAIDLLKTLLKGPEQN